MCDIILHISKNEGRHNMKRRITALAAALIICFTQILPCFAETAQPVLPHIDIRGFMNAAIYEDMNDPRSNQLWPLNVDDILGAAARCIPSLMKFAFDKDYEKLTESLVPYVNELFRPLMCGSDGRPLVEGSGAYLYYPTREEVLVSPDLSFTYDWRIDPYESAERLNDFVNYIADELGFGQVVIECHSNGGVVLLTYLSAYGTAKVKSVCFSAAAVYGAGFAGELVKGNMIIDGSGLAQYLLSAFDNNERAELLTGLMKVLDRAGIVSTLADFANSLIQGAHDFLYKKTILPIFGNWLNIWAMVADDLVEDGKEYIFDNLLADKRDEYIGFIEKIDYFTRNFRQCRQENLLAVKESCNVYVFCFYGYTGIPITVDWTVMSDGVLMSKDSSFGASFYDPGSSDRFDEGEYVSPDGMVNGETALFKDQTWYFKNCHHSMTSPYLDEMAKTLLYSDEQADVNSYEEYPRFLINDRLGGGIRPDNGTVTVRLTFFERIAEFFRGLFERIRAFFTA